jgi:5-methylcytosine-specific restriction endonuclease McrA
MHFTITYEAYIRSQEWRDKAEALKTEAGECAMCGSGVNLEVHHRTYARLGREHPLDLIVLCRPCHARYHGIFDDEWNRQLKLPLLPSGVELN